MPRNLGGNAPFVAGLALAVGLGLTRPSSAGNGVWQTSGPYVGGEYLQSIASDPQDPSTLYAAAGALSGTASCAGVFKSTDSGTTWFPSTLGISLGASYPCVIAIAVDPRSPDVVYALGKNSSLFKSVDAGRAWSEVARGLLPLPGYWSSPGVLLVDHATPTTIYLGLFGGGFFKSQDGGVNWKDAAGGFGRFDVEVVAAAMDPTNPAILYVGTTAGIYKSTNGSATWTLVSDADQGKAVVIDPTNTETVYATAYPGVVIKSTNGGASWTTLNKNFPNRDITDLAMDPTSPATLFLGTREAGVFRSTDAGETWSPASQGLAGPTVFDLTATPRSMTLLGQGGTYRWNDGARAWSAVEIRRAVNVSAVATSRLAPRTQFVTTLDSGAFRSVDGGGTWAAVNSGPLLFFPFHAAAIDPAVPTTVYLCSFSTSLLKSINSGASWAATPAAFCGGLAIDPVSSSNVYAAGSSGVLRSRDGGSTWAVSPPSESVRALVIDPLTPSTLFASIAGAIYRSVDSGVTWTIANSGLAATHLAIDPLTPSTLYASADAQGAFKSLDSGMTWTPMSVGLPGVPVLQVAVDGAAPATLYAATAGQGVFRSTDAGAHWSAFNNGLGSGWVQGLAYDSASSTLYAAVRNGGVWRHRANTGTFHTVAPCRAVDTRAIDGPALAAGVTRTFKLADKCGIPIEAGSISLNITVTGATSSGHLRLYPGNTILPPNSTLNFEPGRTRANSAVVLLGASGDLAIFGGLGAGSVQVIVDVNGYFE